MGFYKDCMSEDIHRRLQQEGLHLNSEFNDDELVTVLVLIEDIILNMTGKPFTQFGLPSPVRQTTEDISREMLRELTYDPHTMNEYVRFNEDLLNAEQQTIYNKVLHRINENEGGIIFIDVPGGTGKTFLINLLLAKIRGQKNWTRNGVFRHSCYTPYGWPDSPCYFGSTNRPH